MPSNENPAADPAAEGDSPVYIQDLIEGVNHEQHASLDFVKHAIRAAMRELVGTYNQSESLTDNEDDEDDEDSYGGDRTEDERRGPPGTGPTTRILSWAARASANTSTAPGDSSDSQLTHFEFQSSITSESISSASPLLQTPDPHTVDLLPLDNHESKDPPPRPIHVVGLKPVYLDVPEVEDTSVIE